MKKSFFGTLIFAFATYLPAFAITTPPIIAKTKLYKEKVIKLQLSNLQQKYTYVSITDMDGELIYFSEGVRKHNGFHKLINIANLVDGLYKIKIKSDRKVLTQIIQVKGEYVYFSNFK